VCDTKVKFELPDSKQYFKGKVFDFGVMNLEMRMSDHESDCIH